MKSPRASKKEFPLTITENGVSAKVRRVTKQKAGAEYVSYMVDYFLLGKRKQEWRADLEEAKQSAREACKKIANGEALSLQLNNGERIVYLRAQEYVAPINVPIDTACKEYAEMYTLLAGRANPMEVARDWLKRHAVELPRVTVAKAVEQLLERAKTDKKSERRQQQLAAGLMRFAENNSCEVHTLTPKQMDDYVTGLPFADRTKRNHRDVLAFFSRWLVMRGYLAKGTDLLEGVQNYSARKTGEITTYSPEEMRRLIAGADKRFRPFIVIAGFAGLRHAEIARLDWADIDLEEGFIEVKAENAKTDTRRIVPIKDNLRAWLKPLAKKSGKVLPFAEKQLPKHLQWTADATKDAEQGIDPVKVKRNALRHTYISARVAECGDVPRVADEAGNSVQVIRTNYLKRWRPNLAVEWFGISPA